MPLRIGIHNFFFFLISKELVYMITKAMTLESEDELAYHVFRLMVLSTLSSSLVLTDYLMML